MHREVVAAKAGGISFYRLFVPIWIAGLMLTGVALALTEVVPRTNKISGQILQAETPGRSWRSDFVYQSENGLTWQVRRLTAADGRMAEVVLERPPTGTETGMHVMASGAGWTPEEGWTLAAGYMRVLQTDSSERTIEFERMRVAEITERPEELLEVPPEPDEMTYAEIDHMAQIIQRTGGNANELLVKKQEKLSIPVMTIVIILFGAPLATSNKRGGTAYGIGLSLATVIAYVMLAQVTGSLGDAGALHPVTAAWIPNGVFLLAAAVALARVRT
jgi:lipopolysaccharide export system permease protein